MVDGEDSPMYSWLTAVGVSSCSMPKQWRLARSVNRLTRIDGIANGFL